MVANTNFPAPLQVLALLGTVFTIVVLGALAMFGGMTKRSWTKLALGGIAIVLGAYILLLVAFSVFSKERLLKAGEEKYFCEIDCHIAYSVAEVKEVPLPGSTERLVLVTVKTRFDEKTISERRPKDVPLQPNPRVIELVDADGRTYGPSPQSRVLGTAEAASVPEQAERPFGDQLRPGESYLTTMVFRVPSAGRGLRLLMVSSDGPEEVLIGSELSFFHKKSYFEINASQIAR